jgi:TetR/AcrR family transcriptional regulator, transcriptional repressor for nem operon
LKFGFVKLKEQMTERITARTALLRAAVKRIRETGFSATSVDDLCEEAGVTKGAFFHHFVSKEALGIAAANYWSETTAALFAGADYHSPVDPLDRVLAYVDFRRALLQGTVPEFTCLVGTMVQEIHQSAPSIRDACNASIFGHAATLVSDITAAKRLYVPDADFEPESLARFTQAVLQGAFTLAKADQGKRFATESVDHLRRYVELLFRIAPTERETTGREVACQ